MEPNEMFKRLYHIPIEKALVVEKKGSLLPVIFGLIGVGIVIYGFHQYMKKEEVPETKT